VITEEQKLLVDLYRDHQDRMNRYFLRISVIYLILSLTWNIVFRWFDLPYSRANLTILTACFAVWCGVAIVQRLLKPPAFLMQHIVQIFNIIVVVCLYFGSGYSESWSFFLIIPLVAGLYGEMKLHYLYSATGAILLWLCSSFYPLPTDAADSIDIANRILLYTIVATLGHVLLRQLKMLYNRQVQTVMEAMETTLEQVVQSFIIAIEAKDSYTFGHSERVSKYAVELAKRLPQYQDENKLHSLRLCGLLHDIGKINIPETVLTKPSRLTKEEFELIKTHTVAGGRMVEKISGLRSLKPGVLYHHERWDGKGYPAGKRGEDIPLEARILAVADAFDAMTTNRSYHNAISFQEAFERLLEEKGAQFDPHLIDKLEEVKLAWNKIYKETTNGFEEFERIIDLI
jgi:hypothetical protein